MCFELKKCISFGVFFNENTCFIPSDSLQSHNDVVCAVFTQVQRNLTLRKTTYLYPILVQAHSYLLTITLSINITLFLHIMAYDLNNHTLYISNTVKKAFAIISTGPYSAVNIDYGKYVLCPQLLELREENIPVTIQ